MFCTCANIFIERYKSKHKLYLFKAMILCIYKCIYQPFHEQDITCFVLFFFVFFKWSSTGVNVRLFNLGMANDLGIFSPSPVTIPMLKNTVNPTF